MYDHILIPTDGSEFAEIGVEHGLSLAKRLGAKVTVAFVTEPFGGQFAHAADYWSPDPETIKDYDDGQARIAEKILAPIKAKADAAGVAAETIHVPRRLVTGGILSLVEQRGCDVIVMSSHGRTGISRALLGSQTSGVLSSAKVPVIVAR